MHNIILENNRILLRPLTLDDYDILLPFSLNEPETWQFAPKSAAGKENLYRYIQDALTQKSANTGIPFIVFDKKLQQYIGSTRLYNINHHNRNADIGYTWYGKDFRGTGINKHCKFLLLQYAFETLNLLRVGFKADASNQISIAAMKSLGATEEGILRQDTLMPDGRFRNTIILSILKCEWESQIKTLLSKQLSD